MSAQCNTFSNFTITFHRFSVRHHIQEEPEGATICNVRLNASPDTPFQFSSTLPPYLESIIIGVSWTARFALSSYVSIASLHLTENSSQSQLSRPYTERNTDVQVFRLKCILLVSNFRQNLNLSTNFNTNPKYKIPRRFVLWRNYVINTTNLVDTSL
jgi:hypothetical protein